MLKHYEPLKIAQVRWCEPTGGVERVLRDLAIYADREHFTHRFFFLARSGPYADEIQAAGFSVSVIPARNGYDLSMRRTLLRQLKAWQPAIIHEHGVPPLVRPFLRLVIKASLLGFEHGEIEINRRKGKPWQNWLNGLEYHLFTKQIVVNSTVNRELVCTTHHLSPARTRVVHLGVDLQQFHFPDSPSTKMEAERLIIGYVGRIQNYDKGTDYLPYLASNLIQNGIREFLIRVIGDGPDREVLRTLTEQVGVQDYFEFLGRRNDVPELLKTVDILVIPSRTEAFGLVGLEALAMGTRVAAFDLPAFTEVLHECPGVRLAAAGDVTALAKAILTLWQIYGKQRLVEASQYVAKHFSANRMVAELENYYLEMAK